MPYLLFLKNDKICNRRQLQNIGGTLRVKKVLTFYVQILCAADDIFQYLSRVSGKISLEISCE